MLSNLCPCCFKLLTLLKISLSLLYTFYFGEIMYLVIKYSQTKPERVVFKWWDYLSKEKGKPTLSYVKK